MEKINRKSFQGVGNIVRFNWHFYLIAFALVIVLLFTRNYLPTTFKCFTKGIIVFTIITTFVSLVVSYFIYDYSNLYTLKWIDFLNIKNNTTLANINAGFDETSSILEHKYPNTNLIVLDFYNANKHTEISIERARKAYPVFPNTINISTDNISLQANSIDYIFLIFAAHEIRNEAERTSFFKQLKNVLKDDGKIIVTEHQRDLPNFIAYTIGFFHFYTNRTWKKIFTKSALYIEKEFKINPFVTTFILTKNGITS